MKKSKLLVLSLLAVSAIGLTSCGEAGPKGEKGDTGIPGEKGETGAAGQDGKDGTNGKSVLNGEGAPKDTLGVDGDSYIDYSSFDYYVKENGKWVKKGNIKGEKGEDGEKGPKGETGEKGEKGDTGSQGATGGQGNKGKTAWSNTILPSEHGYVTVDKGSQVEGEEVTFYFHADPKVNDTEYKLIDLTLNGLNAPVGTTDASKTYLNIVNSSEDNSLTVDMVEGGFVVAATFGTETDKGTLKHYVLGSDGKYYANVNDAYDAGVEKATLEVKESKLVKNLNVDRLFTLDLKENKLQTGNYTINVTGTFNAINSVGDDDGYIENETNDCNVISVGASASGQTGTDSHNGIASGISTFSNSLERYDNASSKASLSIGNKVVVKTKSSSKAAISLNDASASITVEEGSKVVNENDTATGAKAISVTAGTLNVAGEVASTKGVAVEVAPSTVDDGNNTQVIVSGENAKVNGASKAIAVSGGTVTVTSGTVTSDSGTAVEVKQATGETAASTTVTVSSGATISSSSGTAVAVDGGTVNVSGKVESATGSAVTVTQSASSADTTVTVKAGAEVSGTKAVAVDSGSVTVEGGKVTGSENGIEVKGGSVAVSGGTVASTSENADSGSAISIVQTAKSETTSEIKVEVSGSASIESEKASAVTVTKDETVQGDKQSVTIDLTGGSYATNSTDKEAVAVDSSDTDTSVKVTKENIKYAVVTSFTGEGSISSSANSADENTVVTFTIKAATGYVLHGVTVNGENKLSEVEDGKLTATMTSKGITVKVVFKDEKLVDNVEGIDSTGTKKVYDLFDDAIKAGCTSIKLLKDSTTEGVTLSADKSLTIDLNGHTLTTNGDGRNNRINVNSGATLEVKNSSTTKGKIVEGQADFAPIMINNTDASKKSAITVGSNVLLEGWAGVFVNANGGNPAYLTDQVMKTDINISGEINSILDTSGSGGHGVYVNGKYNNTSNEINITLDGAKITSKGNGVYLAGYANTTIKGNTSIEGAEAGIEIRAGKLDIQSGTISSTATEFKADPNPNGSTTTGAALAVVQHTTTLPVDVTISGGTFSGVKGLYAADVQHTNPSLVKIELTGGTFNGSEDGIDIEDGINCEATDAKLLGDIYFAGGEGTEEHPYLIKTKEQLLNTYIYKDKLKHEGSKLYYELDNDIDLTEIGAKKFKDVWLENAELDLNGKTITSLNGGVAYDGNNAVIKNGNFVCANEGSYSIFIGGNEHYDDNNTTGIILENLTCEGGINVCQADVTIKTTNISKVEGRDYYAVWSETNANVTIEDGLYSSKSGIVVMTGVQYAGNITIKGGTFLGQIKLGKESGKIVIEGGTFDQDPTAHGATVDTTKFNVIKSGSDEEGYTYTVVAKSGN